MSTLNALFEVIFLTKKALLSIIDIRGNKLLYLKSIYAENESPRHPQDTLQMEFYRDKIQHFIFFP